MAQPATKERNISVKVLQQELHIKNARQRTDTFEIAGQMVEDLLHSYGFTGSFTMYPGEMQVGSPHFKKRGVILSKPTNQGVVIKLQPGDNRTAWEYKLRPPHGMSIPELWDKLSACHSSGKQTGTVEDIDIPDPILPVDSLALEPEVIQVSRFTVEAFLADSDLIQVFITENAMEGRYTFGQLMELFVDDHDCGAWSPSERQQAVQGMINQAWLIIEGKDTFAPCPKKFLRPKKAPAPSSIVELHPAGVVGTFKSRTPDAVTLTGRRAPATTPKAAVESDLFSLIKTLEEHAARFAAAQQGSRATEARRVALTARLASARSAVTDLESEVARLDATYAEGLQILSDPEFSDAATKLARVKSVLGLD